MINFIVFNFKNSNFSFKQGFFGKHLFINNRFVCALTIFGPNKKLISSIGKIEGSISPVMKGKNGFGYDPIFVPKGKKLTFGEMKASEKYKIDHRFKAFKKIKKFF